MNQPQAAKDMIENGWRFDYDPDELALMASNVKENKETMVFSFSFVSHFNANQFDEFGEAIAKLLNGELE
jgi:hypothetical protein